MPLDQFVIVIIAGIMATFCLLVMSLWAKSLNMPRLDFSRGMAQFTFGPSFEGLAPYFAGMLVVYMNGIFFALLYATAIGPYLPGPALVRGVIFGVGLFWASSLFFSPLFLREGFFLCKLDKNAWSTSLMVHGIYGLVVGWLSPIQGYAGP